MSAPARPLATNSPFTREDALAAGLPEVACTVWSNVFMVAGLQPEETFLVHGAPDKSAALAAALHEKHPQLSVEVAVRLQEVVL
mgnify:CR=1 FL=1